MTAGFQCLIELGIGALDEAQFAARVYVANLCGVPADDLELVAACNRLQDRQWARLESRMRAQWAQMVETAGRPATKPAVDDELAPLDWRPWQLVTPPPPASDDPTELAAGDPLEEDYN
ncbi:MAG: hypothetical protein WBD40_04105 [Tepidisphaeraceae bacterium]